MGIKDGVGKCTGSQRLGSLPGAVLERKLGHTTRGAPQSYKGPQSSGYRAAAGRGRKDDAGAGGKGARRSHKLRHPRPERETEGESEFGSHSHILSRRGRD